MKLMSIWRIVVCVVLTLVFVSIVIEAIKTQKLELQDMIYGLLVLACLAVYAPTVFKHNKDKK